MLVLLLFGRLLVAAGPQETNYTADLTEARRLLESNRLRDALEPLGRALAKNPEAPEPLWMMAVAQLQLGRYEEGFPYARRLLQVAGGQIRSRLLVATYHEVRQEDEQAAALYRSILEEDAKNPEALQKLALLSLRQADTRTAIESLTTILADYPREPRALVPLGVAYLQSGQPSLALEKLSLAIQVDDRLSEAHHLLGSAYSEIGQWEPAHHHLDRALTLRPDDPRTLLQKGLLHSRKEEIPQALDFFRKARDGDPQNALAHFHVAELLYYMKDVEKSEAEYRRAFELMPDLIVARYQLGLLLIEQARHEEALTVLSRVLELDPDHADALRQLGQVYDRMNQPQEARRHFEKALTLAPLSTQLHLNYGNFSMRQGDAARGRELLRRFKELRADEDKTKELLAATDFQPSNLGVKEELIDFLLQAERVEEALQQAQRFLALEPGEPRVYLLLGRAYLALDRQSEATSVLERGLRIAPDDTELRKLIDQARRTKQKRPPGELLHTPIETSSEGI